MSRPKTISDDDARAEVDRLKAEINALRARRRRLQRLLRVRHARAANPAKYEAHKAKMRERYHTNPEHRARVIAAAKAHHQNLKALADKARQAGL